jgi:hypothetical protein
MNLVLQRGREKSGFPFTMECDILVQKTESFITLASSLADYLQGMV